jgi:demethylmenaquinone methyltransferase/2-methoxy-6-polyprenyl-1,4-benzoquinol methylase/phosphoethanolamine N-methyltransferase
MMGHPHGESYIADTEGHTIHSWAKYYDFVLAILSLGRERKFRQAALDLVSIEPGMNILDVGCGTGSLTVAAKKKQGIEGNVVGIDPSSNMVELAQQKADKAGVGVEFRVGVIENLEFDDDHFDLVLSSLMMHHLTDDLKEIGLREIQRVVKPGGKLLIIELDPGAFSLASLVHGHSEKLSAELKATRRKMGELGFESLESGQLNFRGFSYLRGTTDQQRIPG